MEHGRPFVRTRIGAVLSVMTCLVLAVVVFGYALPSSTAAPPAVRVELPDTMERLDPASLPLADKVLFAARTRSGGYPTFNVIRETAPVPGGGKPAALAEELASQYRSLGLAEVRVVQADSRTLAKYPGTITSELSYTASDGRRTALVSCIPTGDEHLIVTFITDTDRLEADRALEQKLLNGLHVEGMDPILVGEGDRVVSQGAYLVPAGMVVLALAVVLGARRWMKGRAG